MYRIHEDSLWRILSHYVGKAKVIHIENGKGKDVFQKFRTEIAGKVDHEQIQYISMEIYPAFKSGARGYFPKAKIVFDKFHVTKMTNDSVDRVRRTESKEKHVLKNKSNRLYFWQGV